jgi:hypothetical protein
LKAEDAESHQWRTGVTYSRTACSASHNVSSRCITRIQEYRLKKVNLGLRVAFEIAVVRS